MHAAYERRRLAPFLVEGRFFAVDRFFAARRPGFTRSGSFFPPVSRFHSSKVCGEILPSTSSCANLRRCAWLLNGMRMSRYIQPSCLRLNPSFQIFVM